MSAVPVSRRADLRFQDFEQVSAELDLLLGGYSQTGRWTLGQICDHLRDWTLYSVDGYPRAPAPIRLVAWTVRSTIGPRQLSKLLAAGQMPTGTPTLRESVHSSDSRDAEAVERYKSAIARFEAHKGDYHASPFFGPLDRSAARRLQLIHSAHHLGFLIPTAPAGGASRQR